MLEMLEIESRHPHAFSLDSLLSLSIEKLYLKAPLRRIVSRGSICGASHRKYVWAQLREADGLL